jgi:hypothetical protein
MANGTTIEQPVVPPAGGKLVGGLHPRRTLRLPKLRPLSLGVRITLHVLGWLLAVIGVAGLFLPVLPGGLAIAAGLAVLSVASRSLHQWLRPKFRRWPRGWRRLERFRRRLHRRLEPRQVD